jgi:hypothetical protein
MASNRARGLQVIDPFLTNVARRYKPTGFIARQLLPTIPVSKLSGQYPVFTRGFWFRIHETLGSDRAPSNEIDFEWSTESFLCDEHKLKVSMTDLEKSQAEDVLRFESSKTEFLTHHMELAYEKRVADLLTVAGGLNNGAAPSVNWDQATATIEEDIKTAVLAVYDDIGRTPNVIVIPYKVAYAMAVQEDIRSILHYQVSGNSNDFIQLGSRVLPNEIHGLRVIIPQGVQYDTNNEGGSDTVAEVWGDDVRVLYIDPNAGWGMPTVAYRIQHTAKTVTRWRETDPDVEYIRELERFDLKIVAPDAGYEIQNVLS